MYPLVRELAGDGIPVTVTCRVLKLARQPYYRWLAAPVTDRELDEAYLANVLFDADRDDPEFGYRFLADEVHAAGFVVSERTVWKRCSENGWWSAFGKKRSRQRARPGTPAHDDLVRRDFTAAAPNRLWLADITEHRTDEGKLYVCAIKDVFSNRIVGWAIDERMKARLVVAAIEMAVARRGDVAGCILHSDRAANFALGRSTGRWPAIAWSGRWARSARPLTTRRWNRSSRLLQRNVLDRRRWATRGELRIAIVTWIERTYHRRRRQATLGRLTPIEYEIIMTPPATLAA